MELAFAIGKHLLGSLAIGYIIMQIMWMFAIGQSLASGRINKINFYPNSFFIGAATAVAIWAFG